MQFLQDWDLKDCIHTKEVVYHSLLSILEEVILNWQQFYCHSMEAPAYQILSNCAQALVPLLMENQVYHTYMVFFYSSSTSANFPFFYSLSSDLSLYEHTVKCETAKISFFLVFAILQN